MLRATALLRPNCKLSINLYRAYLTQEFKNVMNQNVSIDDISRDKIEAIHVNKRTSAVRVDFMARQMTSTDEARSDIIDELFKLRNQADATDIIGSTSCAVIKHFVDVGATTELLELLRDRLKYGVFVDKYSGSYLMDHFIENKQFSEALQVAVEHYLQDDYDSQLVCALTLKAAYEALKRNSIYSVESPKAEEPKEEKKVRVKFIRNIDPDDRSSDFKYMIGKTLLKMSENTSANIKDNFSILGYILSDQYENCQKALKANTTLDKDVLAACIEIQKNTTGAPVELNESLQAQFMQAQSVLDTPLNEYLYDAIKKEEPQLIQQQSDNYKLWTQQLHDSLNAAIVHREKLMRLENIDQIMEEIKVKKKQLWYFEMEDSVDMEIYKKYQYYPKKWFGKKKKPRMVDDSYIPPELR